MNKRIFLFILISLILNFGCAKKSDNAQTPYQLNALAQSDLVKMQSESDSGPKTFDTKYAGLFTSIFGGTRGSDVYTFFTTRISHILTVSDNAQVEISPHDFTYKLWLDSPNTGFMDAGKTEVGAGNIGITYWLQSLVNHVQVTLVYGGQRFPITSSRVGIILLGDGYKEIGDVNGTSVTLPSEYRQSILAHEARHSDCTGGITEANLDIARTSQNLKDFSTRFESIPCGHIHVYCPANSPYHDLPACDSQPWGAYSIGAVYSQAVAGNLSGIDRQIMLADAIDSFGRLQFDYQSMLDGKMGAPDMTSSGLQGP